jgi:hypothetical protein
LCIVGGGVSGGWRSRTRFTVLKGERGLLGIDGAIFRTTAWAVLQVVVERRGIRTERGRSFFSVTIAPSPLELIRQRPLKCNAYRAAEPALHKLNFQEFTYEADFHTLNLQDASCSASQIIGVRKNGFSKTRGTMRSSR